MATFSQYPTKAGGWQWKARVYQDGKQYSGSGSTKLQARKKAEANAAAARASKPGDHATTLGPFMEEWLAKREKRLAASTTRGNRMHYEKHIKGPLGHLPLEALTLRLLQDWVDKLATPDQMKRCQLLLKQCLDKAVDYDLLAKNPCTRLELPKIERREQQAWDKEQVARFMAVPMALHYQVYFWLALCFPVRPGEVLGLRWSALDLAAGKASIIESRSTYNGQTVPGNLKNPESRRTGYIIPQAQEVLIRWKAAQDELRERLGQSWQGEDYVCTNETGEPLREHTVNQMFKRTLKRAGLPNITLYELRHTVVTGWARNGTSAEITAAAAGHTNTLTTLNVYRRIHPDELRGAAMGWGKGLIDSVSGPIAAND